MSLKAEVRAAVRRLIQTDSHVTVMQLMERTERTEETLPESDHVIAFCQETRDLRHSDAYCAFYSKPVHMYTVTHTHTPQ